MTGGTHLSDTNLSQLVSSFIVKKIKIIVNLGEKYNC